eukprot:7887218-Alexandrium_andersonii.AAC.1
MAAGFVWLPPAAPSVKKSLREPQQKGGGHHGEADGAAARIPALSPALKSCALKSGVSVYTCCRVID